MFVCPSCKNLFSTETLFVKHFTKCWKEHNPNHMSKPAPRSEDLNTREDSQDILNFFKSLK